MVEYQDNVIETIVSLSKRYITDKQFPDKAIDILDELGSEKKINVKIPAIIEKLRNQSDLIKLDKQEMVRNQDLMKTKLYQALFEVIELPLPMLKEYDAHFFDTKYNFLSQCLKVHFFLVIQILTN